MKTLTIILLLTAFAASELFCQNLVWKSANGTQWNAISDAIIDKNGKIYVSTYNDSYYHSIGTIYRSSDNGKSWQNLNISPNNYGVSQVLITKNNLIIAAQYGNDLSISDNNGLSWISLKNQFKSTHFKKIVELSNGKLIAFIDPQGVYKSDDGGYNWTFIIDTIPGTNDIKQVITVNDILYRLDYYCVFKSTDYGNTWSWIKLGKNNGLSTLLSKNNIVYLVDYGKSSLFYMNYMDDTLRVSKTVLDETGFLNNFSIISITTDNRMIAQTNNGIRISDTLFGNWQYFGIKINNKNYPNFTYAGLINNRLFFGNIDGNLVVLDSDLIKQYNIHKNLINQKTTNMLADSNFILSVIDSITLNISFDSGNSWYSLTEENPEFKSINGIAIDSNRNIYALIDSNFVKIDLDRKRTILNFGLKEKIINIVNDLDCNIYATTYNGIYKYNQNLLSWTLIDSNVKNNLILNKKNNSLLLRDSTNLKLFNTFKNKITLLNNLPDSIFKVTAAAVSEDSTIFISFKNSGLYKSVDYGLSWVETDDQITNKNISSILIVDNQKLIVGTSKNGVYFTNNGGKIWESDNNGLASGKIYDLDKFSDQAIYVGTADKGIFVIDSILNKNIEFISGWNDSTAFKQQKYQIPPISKIKFSVDSKRFITFSSDTTVRIWDIETGNLLSEYPIKFTSINDVDLNENENWIAIAIATDSAYYPKWHSFIYDFYNDTIISSFDGYIFYSTSSGMPTYTVTNQRIIFTNNQKEFFNHQNIVEDIGGGGNYSGTNNLYNIDSSKSIWTVSQGSLIYMKFAKNNNLFYYSGHDSWWRSQSHGGGSGDNYYQFLVDITSKKYNKLKNINTNLADFSYDDKYFAYYIDSIKKVIIYNLSNSKIESYLNYNNNNPENKLNDIAFGYTNYDLYFSTTNKLYHWSHWKGTIVDSFNLSGANGEVWQLLCSKDGKYLLAASNQGHIRIFDMEKVMSVDDIDKASQPEDLIVSPIPANQLLITNYKLRDDCFVRLSLFNQLGIEAAVLVNEFQPSGPHNSQLSILNSQLSAGVYFLKLKACGINRMKKVVIMR